MTMMIAKYLLIKKKSIQRLESLLENIFKEI